jgi:hypothetical protein
MKDAGEGVGHDANQRAVAQADEGRGVDAIDQHSKFNGLGIGEAAKSPQPGVDSG